MTMNITKRTITTSSIDNNSMKSVVSDSNVTQIEQLSVIESHESTCSIYLQIFFPFIIAGVGMVLAGVVLDTLQHWPAFQDQPDIFIMVPALLGLKGNLEMTLSSRLSTHANLGTFGNSKHLISLSLGNIMLTQLQAIVVGQLAAVFAITLSVISADRTINDVLFLSATSVTTASLTTLILSMIMVLVVILSNRMTLNPDNLATPIAASLGDFTTLCVLAKVTTWLHHSNMTVVYLSILAFYLLIVPFLVRITAKNTFTREILFHGWLPVISAMLISSLGGFLLKIFAYRLHRLALYQPIINGVGGNIVAIQSSRMSTHLHQLGSHSCDVKKDVNDTICTHCVTPKVAFCSFTNVHSRTSRILLSMVIPGHLVFILCALLIGNARDVNTHGSITVGFVVVYLAACFLQVMILLTLAQWLVHFVWSRGQDPDNVAIPYLTGLGDLLGALLLTAALSIIELPFVKANIDVL